MVAVIQSNGHGGHADGDDAPIAATSRPIMNVFERVALAGIELLTLRIKTGTGREGGLRGCSREL
jgi:hypothetical protein